MPARDEEREEWVGGARGGWGGQEGRERMRLLLEMETLLVRDCRREGDTREFRGWASREYDYWTRRMAQGKASASRLIISLSRSAQRPQMTGRNSFQLDDGDLGCKPS